MLKNSSVRLGIHILFLLTLVSGIFTILDRFIQMMSGGFKYSILFMIPFLILWVLLLCGIAFLAAKSNGTGGIGTALPAIFADARSLTITGVIIAGSSVLSIVSMLSYTFSSFITQLTTDLGDRKLSIMWETITSSFTGIGESLLKIIIGIAIIYIFHKKATQP